MYHLEEKSKLLLSTYDARLTDLKISPKCCNTKMSYKLKMYDETLQKKITKMMYFENVVAIEFSMNYFDNPIGTECCGFYEILEMQEKEDLLERNFISRRNGFILHGDYVYDEQEPNDILNYRESIDDIRKELSQYRLFQQQTTGGIYYILAKMWSMKERK